MSNLPPIIRFRLTSTPLLWAVGVGNEEAAHIEMRVRWYVYGRGCGLRAKHARLGIGGLFV